MSQPIRSFFSGVIIQSLAIAFILGATSLILDDKFKRIEENSKVSRQAQIAAIKLETEIPRLTVAVSKLSNRLEALFDHQREHEANMPIWEVWRSKVDIKIEHIDEDVDGIEATIDKYKHTHTKGWQ